MWKIPAAMSETTAVLSFFKKGQIPGKASTEGKEAKECWDFFKNALLRAQNQFFPFKDEGCRRSKSPLDLTVSFLVCSKAKHARDGNVDKCLLRTTWTLPGCAKMQLEKKKLNSN